MRREGPLERRCCALVRKLGGMPLKLWPTLAGLPDRLCLLPGGVFLFVEFKAPDGQVSPIQRRVFDALGALGFPVSIVRNYQTFTILLAVKAEKE